MKTIGLIGGTTWLSTLEYYRIINETVKDKLGKKHSAKCILYSIDFEEIMVKNWDNWDEITKSFIDISKRLEKAGAELLIICANTPHKIADNIQENISIPLVHIADATAKKIKEKNLKKVGLIGTKYTMNEDFFKKRLKEKYNIETVIPNSYDQKIIEDVIENELTFDIIKNSSKQKYIKIIKKLVSKGAEGVILGCTEIPLLIKQSDLDIPVFDTTSIHAKESVEYALKKC
jgi:aspartate racemase